MLRHTLMLTLLAAATVTIIPSGSAQTGIDWNEDGDCKDDADLLASDGRTILIVTFGLGGDVAGYVAVGGTDGVIAALATPAGTFSAGGPLGATASERIGPGQSVGVEAGPVHDNVRPGGVPVVNGMLAQGESMDLGQGIIRLESGP